MNNTLALSAAEERMPKMTLDEFERRASTYVETTLDELLSGEHTRDQYVDSEAFRADLRKSFHKIMTRHYVLIDSTGLAP